jgi:hypothetical protein
MVSEMMLTSGSSSIKSSFVFKVIKIVKLNPKVLDHLEQQSLGAAESKRY